MGISRGYHEIQQDIYIYHQELETYCNIMNTLGNIPNRLAIDLWSNNVMKGITPYVHQPISGIHYIWVV